MVCFFCFFFAGYLFLYSVRFSCSGNSIGWGSCKCLWMILVLLIVLATAIRHCFSLSPLAIFLHSWILKLVFIISFCSFLYYFLLSILVIFLFFSTLLSVLSVPCSGLSLFIYSLYFLSYCFLIKSANLFFLFFYCSIMSASP